MCRDKNAVSKWTRLPPGPGVEVVELDRDGEEEVEEEEDDGAKAATAAASTFQRLRGETVSSQLLEPEVIHLLGEFSSLFARLFDAYRDTPIGGCDASQGHLSFAGFLRFCCDFRLFPNIVDYQTAHHFYSTVEARYDARVSGPRVNVTMHEGQPLDGTTRSDATSRLAETSRRGRALDGAGRRGRGLNNTISSAASTTALVPEEPPPVLWNGKWLKAQLQWTTQAFLDMSAAEQRCILLLGALDDWLTDRKLQVADVFGLMDRDRDGHVTCDTLRKALESMQF
jgi:hypothetical protein